MTGEAGSGDLKVVVEKLKENDNMYRAWMLEKAEDVLSL